MTNKEYGNILENAVANKFMSIGYKYARPSKGSGSKGEAGDTAGQDICVTECKQRNTKDISIKIDVWKKLCKEIPLHSERFPVYFLGNKDNERFAVVDIDTFFNLLECYLTVQRGDM